MEVTVIIVSFGPVLGPRAQMDATTWERRMKKTIMFLILFNKYSGSVPFVFYYYY